MQTVPQGSPIQLSFTLKDASGEFIDATALSVLIRDSVGGIAVTSGTPTKIRTGLWTYSFSVPLDAVVGIWSITWTGYASSADFETDDVFEVAYQGTPFVSELSHILRAARGQRVALDAIFRAGSGRVNASDLEVSVSDPDGDEVTLVGSPEHLATGVYRLWWVVPYNAVNGVHVVTWSATVANEQAAFEDVIEIVDAVPEPPGSSSGIDRVPVGKISQFDATFRSAGFALWDPDSPRLQITDPNGLVVFEGLPSRLATGVYRETLSLGVPGIWTLDWSAEEDEVEVSSAVAVEAVIVGDGSPSIIEDHLYGASIAGVRALLPHLDIDHDTRPTFQQVETFLDNIASEVSLRVGLYSSVITDSGLVDRITGMAKMVVELGAAATAEDAAYPTRSSPNDTSYGSVLWERYKEALMALVEVVNNATPGIDPGAGLPGGSGAVSAPPPQFSVWMRT